VAFAVRGTINFTGPPSILHAPPSFLLAPHAPPSFVVVPQQMAAVNFGHFYSVKSTNSLCTFLTLQTVINKLL
jgi:hypothetical protein